MNELKPCPFCGSNPILNQHKYKGGGGYWEIGCERLGCVAYSIVTTFRSQDDAIEAWNRRANDV